MNHLSLLPFPEGLFLSAIIGAQEKCHTAVGRYSRRPMFFMSFGSTRSWGMTANSSALECSIYFYLAGKCCPVKGGFLLSNY
jgi:hypothetical protein